MKKVFSSHSQLAHVWAQNNQSEGRSGDGRMFFKDGKLYSYGRHFCIARILPSGVVVFGNHSYSSSTGKHQSEARRAISHRRIVWCQDPDSSAWINREWTEERIKRHLEEAETTRRVKPATRVYSKQSAYRLAEEFNKYLAALPKEEGEPLPPFDLTPLEISAAEREIVAQYEAELQERREARWARESAQRKVRDAQMALSEAEKIAEWRAGTYLHTLYHVPTMLRLSKDGTEVQTSRGASIPVSHAKRLWPIIENVRAVGMGLTDRDIRLGHFTLTQIKPDGSIVVGCHDIPYAEIERIAKALGLMEEVSS